MTKTHNRCGSPEAPGLVLVADGPDVSRFVRLPGALDVPSAPLAKAIEDAVHAGVVVEFYAAHGDQVPAFRLSRRYAVVQVYSGAERHMGTFASGAAAVRHGWERSRVPARGARRSKQ